MSVTDYLLAQLISTYKAYAKRWDFDASGNLTYFGWAEAGTSDSEKGWTIKKLTYDASSNPVSENITAPGSAVWDNRTTYF